MIEKNQAHSLPDYYEELFKMKLSHLRTLCPEDPGPNNSLRVVFFTRSFKDPAGEELIDDVLERPSI